jgi:UDP-N-acetylmuramyl tripeptide synthase
MSRTFSLSQARLVASLASAKATATGIRRLGRGGGTSAPGLVAERIDPGMLRKLTAGLADGVIVVAGTNGKTTTSRMIADILTASDRKVVHNRSGSNLVRGVVSAFASQASWTGHPGGDVAVIETDEAAFPEVVRLVTPRVILLNNLFRDQLDRYGELDTIARSWTSTLAGLGPESTVIYNADDPGLTAVTQGLRARTVAFGMTGGQHTLSTLPHAADAAVCFRCGTDLAYRALYVSHLGDWYCPGCEAARPELDVAGSDTELDGVESLGLTIDRGGESDRYAVGVPGFYNAYNTLAAVAATRHMGVPQGTVQTALVQFRSAFGRIERVTYRDRQLTLALVKNPVGFNEVLRMLTAGTGELTVPALIAINDLYADGRDVSWLWDVDFELLAGGNSTLATSGLRGADMANRLKYAGIAESRIETLPEGLARGLDGFVDLIPEGTQGYILPTYTAMLEIRRVLAERGAVESFWEQ